MYQHGDSEIQNATIGNLKLKSPLVATSGGTGFASYSIGNLLYADTTTTLAKVTPNTTTQKRFMSMTGTGIAGAAPVFGNISLTTDVVGLLGPPFGGTGLSTYISGDILWANTSSSLSRLPIGGSGSILISTGTQPSWSSFSFPSTATTGDLLYASATNTWANLADVAVGQGLMSGGVGVAPAWTGSPSWSGTGTFQGGTLTLGSATKPAKIITLNTGKSVFVGEGAGAAADGVVDRLNVFIGYNAGNVNSSGSNSIGIGYAALTLNDTGSSNVAIGAFALDSNVSGSNNVAVGQDALEGNTGNSNTAVGYSALFRNTSGSFNTAVGVNAAVAVTTGGSNTALGRSAMSLATTGSTNTAIGEEALALNITGSGNVALGSKAGEYETGSNFFYVNNQDRTNLAGDQTKSLLYGTFAATAANQQLTVNAGTFTLTGNVTLSPAAGSTAAGIIYEGTTRLLHTYTPSAGEDSNFFAGQLAGNFTLTGTIARNVGTGYGALNRLTTGYQNTASGYLALFGVTTGFENTGIGNSAGANVTTGSYNTLIGTASGNGFVTGQQNTTLGHAAGYLATGDSNVFLGQQAGYYETGSNKLFIDNTTRTNEADGRVKALVYGVFTATTAAQSLTVNGSFTTVEAITAGTNLALAATGTFTWTGRSIASSSADGRLLLTNNAATDFGLLQLGGTSNAFPALKRSSAELQARLADDSAAANFRANVVYADNSLVTGAWAIAGEISVNYNYAVTQEMASTFALAWNNAASIGGTLDVGLVRGAAGSLYVTDGLGNNYNGNLFAYDIRATNKLYVNATLTAFTDFLQGDGYNLWMTNTQNSTVMLAAGMQVGWTSVANANGATADTGFKRAAASVAKITDGSTGYGWLTQTGRTARTTTQTVTDSTTLTADDTLTATLIAGRKYHVWLTYYCTTVATSGIKVDLGGGNATFTTVQGTIAIKDITASYTVLGGGEVTSSTTAVGITATGTSTKIEAEFYIKCNQAGTITPRFAQNNETIAAESVIAKIGSTMLIEDIP